MPLYQFMAPAGSATLVRNAEIAAASTRVHTEVTGAPGTYVHCSFVEVQPGSLFAAGLPSSAPRMVGIIRSGRSAEVKARLLHRLASEWSGITRERIEDLAIFLCEVPGANILEDGQILPEI